MIRFGPLAIGTVLLVNGLLPLNLCGQRLFPRGSESKVRMPGKSYEGKLPDLTESQAQLADALKQHVGHLASEIGIRTVHQYDNLIKAEKYLADQLSRAGYEVRRQTYRVRGRDCSNLIAERTGTELPDQIVVVGGHYDSAANTPGANDNATGTAAVLELAKKFADRKPRRTWRFVLFVNEEPPWFQTSAMGSLVYAKQCKNRKENIVAMFSMETIGYYSDRPRTQKYPPPFNRYYPSTGNFIGFVGDVASEPLVSWTVKTFREQGSFPSEGAAVQRHIEGIGWSDHWSFWQVGYPALMVTDTAPFRYPHYHRRSDTPDKIDYSRMARVVDGFDLVLQQLDQLK